MRALLPPPPPPPLSQFPRRLRVLILFRLCPKSQSSTSLNLRRWIVYLLNLIVRKILSSQSIFSHYLFAELLFPLQLYLLNEFHNFFLIFVEYMLIFS